MPPPFAVVPAKSEDVDAMLAMLEEARAWVRARGLSQWPGGPFLREPVAQHVARGEAHLLRDTLNGEAAGMLYFLWNDPDIWPNAAAEDAGYVHRLVARRAYAGRGLGAALLDWAAGSVRDAGRAYLRLDCDAENAPLLAYYRGAGFIDRGDFAGNGWTVRRFERRVAP